MKKLLYCAAALATLLFAASCQQEKLEPVGGPVRFTVTAPGGLDTRAIADGENVNEVHWAVYRTTKDYVIDETDEIDGALAQGVVPMSNKTATVELDLLQDQYYTILFWAQVKDAGHYELGDLREVKIVSESKTDPETGEVYQTIDANDESRAAFFQRHDFSTFSQQNYDVTLYRPFAQINLGTTDESLTPSQEGQTNGYTIGVKESEMTVKGIATSFNLLTGEAKDEAVDFKFESTETPALAGEKLEVNDVEYHYVAMNYLLVPVQEKTVSVSYKITTDKGIVENTIGSVPIKENYRTNIIGNLLTSKTEFEIVVHEEFKKPDEVVVDGATVVTNDAELAAALDEDKAHINIYLDPSGVASSTKAGEQNFKIQVSANNPDYYFGGASTKTITINANGNTIEFVHNNTDWNYIRCVNDAAKWIINDAHLTNSGANNGPWNRHDIRFYNAVELNNVTSDKAIALLNDGKLTDVQISDVHPENSEAYGLWITAEGQTVSLDGVTITPSEGKTTDRAIKIADQYVASPSKVTLNVSNSKFVSQKKAAVLVTSKAGAVINWGRGNDITGVAADPANAVWVDGDQDYQNIEDVTVTGASVIIEGQVSSTPVVTNAEELKAAIAAANNDKQTVILLKAGTYTGAFDIDGKNVALIGEDGVVIDGLVHGLNFAHILLRNITLTNATPATSESARHTADNYCLGAYVTDFVIEDCVFNVNNTGAAAGKGAINIYANRSDYKTSEIDGVQYDLVIRNTTFNCNGERPIRGKTNSYIEGCTFNDQYRYAIQVQGNSDLATETVTFINNKIVNPCATSGEAFAAGVSISKSQLLEEAAFNIYGNTLESAKFEDLKFVYDISDNVQITTCTLNGKQIAAGRCVSIPGVTDAKEVVMDYTDGLAYAVTNADLLAALQDGATHIYLYPGNYELAHPTIAADNVVIEGADKEACVLKITKQIRAKDGVTVLTLKNLTTQVPTGLNYDEHNFAWIHYLKEFNMIDCNSDGRIRLNSHKANIERCAFTVTTSSGFDGYAVHYQGADKSTVNVKSCTFNTAGKAIVMYNEGKPVFDLTVEDCTFTSSDPSTDKAAIQMHTEYGISGTLDITKCTATGFADVNGGLWNELNNNTKVPTYNFTITVDGATVQEAGWAKVNEGVYNKENEYKLTNATGLFWFANEVNINGNTFSGKTLKLTADIDLKNAAWTPVGQTGATQFKGTFDGQESTIYNLNVDATADTRDHCSSGLFGWLNSAVVKNVKVDGATVKGNHNVGVIGGYLETTGCTIENCHVTNAAVECHVANSEANGDKCGVIVGHAGNAGVVVKDCTAAESTVSAGRDAGQIVGAAKEVNVTGCSATNVTVTANGEGTGANIRNEVIGRLL